MQDNTVALRRTPEIEGRVVERSTRIPVLATAVVCQPVCRRAADERISGRLERLRPRKEGEADDVRRDQDDEKPRRSQRPRRLDDRRFYGRHDVRAADLDVDIE